MRKSRDAFRTISEVAQELDLPQHVLRFWETRFSQIKPMKRGGGRRYYRPDDVELLRGIRHLLYGEGYTIKGVQRILKEQGVRHVIEAFPGYVRDDGEEQGEGAEQSVPAAQAAVSDPMPTSPVQDQQAQLQSQIAAQNPGTAAPNPAPLQPAATAAPAPVVPTSAAPVFAAEQEAQPAVQNIEASPVLESAPFVAPTVAAPAQAPAQSVGNSVPAAAPSIPQPQPAMQSYQAQTPESNMQPQAPVTAPMPAPLGGQTVPSDAALAPAATSSIQQGAATAMSAPAVAIAAQPHEINPVPHADLSTVAQSVMVPHVSQPTPTPPDLTQGDPVFLNGQDAAFSVEAGRNSLAQQDQKSGFFSRLRGKPAGETPSGPEAQIAESKTMPRDDVRRLQSTLFEMLECKRILDQARSGNK